MDIVEGQVLFNHRSSGGGFVFAAQNYTDLHLLYHSEELNSPIQQSRVYVWRRVVVKVTRIK